jgi:branched-chain amino acid transport system ATP-binding protein
VLEVRGVSKNYGGLKAVADVSFTVASGEIQGIAGPNGAGKTTLFDCITGHTRASAGDVLVAGESVITASVHHRCHAGLARTFQQPMVAGSLTVLENMLLAIRQSKQGSRSAAHSLAMERLEFIGMSDGVTRTAGLLGVFDTKKLMIGTALATGAKVLLLDEPFGGLSLHEIDATMDLVNQARDTGVAVVVIEHVMRALTALADRVLVMHHGATFFEGTPEEMLTNDAVIEVYLGSKHRKAAS